MFKASLLDDLDKVFFNESEFAETCSIDGRELVAIIRQESHKERSARAATAYEGFYEECIILYINKAVLGFEPAYQQRMNINGKFYLADGCKNSGGLLEISLVRNRT